jgi:hypothetical protein
MNNLGKKIVATIFLIIYFTVNAIQLPSFSIANAPPPSPFHSTPPFETPTVPSSPTMTTLSSSQVGFMFIPASKIEPGPDTPNSRSHGTSTVLPLDGAQNHRTHGPGSPAARLSQRRRGGHFYLQTWEWRRKGV